MSARLRRKVVLVTSGLGTAHGGIGVVSQSILKALAGEHEVALWRHPVALPRPLRKGTFAARGLWRSLSRPDFVFYEHVHLAAIHHLLPRLKGVPYGVFLHGIEVWEPLVTRRREALLLANILLSNSAATVTAARAVNPWLPEVKVTWLGVPRRQAAVRAGELPPVGLIVGRMASVERLKGHDPVLDAWPEVRKSIPAARLLIVGSGNDQARLRRRVAQEQIAGVEFLGRLSDQERDQLYARCRLFFFPSKQEGFGLAGVEAAAAGVPVIGLAGTVMSELFPSGGAILVNDLLASTITQAAVRVLGDSAYATAVGLAARQRVEEHFLEEHFIARFQAALQPLLQ
ncbi:MAG: glycosyltransferase family 4 protein [Terriglobales bacterium]